MSDASVIVQITDTHIAAPGERPYGADTADNLRRVAGCVREMQLDPAAIVLTGDLSDDGSAASYEHLRTIVSEELVPIGCPILPVVGNHDHRATFRSAYLGEDNADDDAPHCYIVDIGEADDRVRIVMCDSYLAGAVTGRLGADQLAWLDDQLTTAGRRTCVVALHHPSVPRGLPREDDYLLEDREAFGTVLARHQVAAVLCGHSHVATAAWFGATMHVAAPATAYLLDPSRRTGGRGYTGAGFAICTIRQRRAIVNPVLVPMQGVELFAH